MKDGRRGRGGGEGDCSKRHSLGTVIDRLEGVPIDSIEKRARERGRVFSTQKTLVC